MLVCPRCGTGNFKTRRSLTVHLARYCTRPTYLSNALTTITPTSRRSYDERHPLSAANTAIQQARHFNAPEIDVAVPTMNTLQAMPSLAHLSATQSELESSNFRFSAFEDTDFSQNNEEDDDVAIPENNAENIVIETCSFVRNSIRLPPDVAFQVHCLSIISQHRGNDLNMFNQVIQCVSGHAIHRNVDFKTLHTMSRDQLLQRLCNYYKLDFLKPTLHNVPLSDGSVATVPIFDVKAMLLSFLNDPKKMRTENFAPNYDIFTGKSTITNPLLDEIHTGSIWNAALDKYCGDDPNAFPLALVCFYDKTHTDLHGSLACAPFICTPAFLNRECRNDDSNYMVLGYIPNLGHGKGEAKVQTPTMRLQDEHNCLALITKQIVQIQENGGFWTKVKGKTVCV